MSSRERTGNDRISAKGGSCSVYSGILLGEIIENDPDEISLGIIYSRDSEVGIGLEWNSGNSDRVGVLGRFDIEEARDIADSIHSICDQLEDGGLE